MNNPRNSDTNMVIWCQCCGKETLSRSRHGRCPQCAREKAQSCMHIEMSFLVGNSVVWVKCMTCDTVAATVMGSYSVFTANWARLALDHKIQDPRMAPYEWEPASQKKEEHPS
jgi:hypothetical protein